MYFIKKIFNPEIFQGGNKKRKYFEGWYFKLIDKKMENALAIIPGVSIDKIGQNSHAFIQVMDKFKGTSDYFKYDISQFKYNKNKFEIEIGDNYFSANNIRINIDKYNKIIKGDLTFENIIPYPKTILKPGIMGPFGFVPFMECYHSILNIHNNIRGQLDISTKRVDFSDGYGYVEKDWGTSFPESWIWLQSNHFESQDVSLMFSVAKIPWLGRSFLGFLSFIKVKEKLHVFSSYTGAKIQKMEHIENNLKVELTDKHFKMEIDAAHSNAGILIAPQNGIMNRQILESLSATVKIKLTDTDGKVVYEGFGTNTGLEIENDIFNYFNETNKKSKQLFRFKRLK